MGNEKNEKNADVNAPKNAQVSAATLRAEARERMSVRAVETFEALAHATALAHAEVKRAQGSATIVEASAKNVREAYGALRALLSDVSAARTLERAQKKAKALGISMHLER